MSNINPPDVILLWCPIGNAVNAAYPPGLVDQSTGYPILEPYSYNGIHYTNETGVVIQLNTGIDLTAATTQSISVVRPNGTFTTWSATIVALGGVNSVLQYTTQPGDFYYPGTYFIQPVVTFSTNVSTGTASSFTVANALMGSSVPAPTPIVPAGTPASFGFTATAGQVQFVLAYANALVQWVAISGTMQSAAKGDYAVTHGVGSTIITVSSGLNLGDTLFGVAII